MQKNFGLIYMRLKSISYVEWQGSTQEWRLETLAFSPRMLIVGKNAAGKSRSVRVAAGLARSILGMQPPGLSGEYIATFDCDGKEYVYELKYLDAQVVLEKISVDGKVLLDRGQGGVGTILAEQISSGTQIPFQVPPNILAAVARRDAIQHSFIEPLFDWANSLRFYQFGGILQNTLAILSPLGQQVDDRDENAVLGIFKEGLKLFGDPFIDSLKADLAAIDYDVEKIELASPVSIRFATGGPQPVSLNLKERGLQGITDQFGMSTGMFRVLALLIHVNFAQFKGSASSVLIDDIGEGLDFDRSLRLIELLRDKAEKYSFQLVMTTNDKFVMNHVPLEEWTVLHRSASVVHVRNQENSKVAFDEFKFTGLSNFSFFEMNAIEMNFDGVGAQDDA
jgi:AAA domain, putative AbiEii toxin, Type IV TA system